MASDLLPLCPRFHFPKQTVCCPAIGVAFHIPLLPQNLTTHRHQLFCSQASLLSNQFSSVAPCVAQCSSVYFYFSSLRLREKGRRKEGGRIRERNIRKQHFTPLHFFRHPPTIHKQSSSLEFGWTWKGEVEVGEGESPAKLKNLNRDCDHHQPILSRDIFAMGVRLRDANYK